MSLDIIDESQGSIAARRISINRRLLALMSLLHFFCLCSGGQKISWFFCLGLLFDIILSHLYPKGYDHPCFVSFLCHWYLGTCILPDFLTSRLLCTIINLRRSQYTHNFFQAKHII